MNLIKNAQSNIKEKRERLKSLNQYDKNMHRGCIDEIRRVKEKRNSCFSVISDAKTRKKELCMEHKKLSYAVKEIKNSYSNDPWFNDKISRLNTLSAYIDKANNEIDTYKVYISAYDREKEEIQKRLDWYSSNLDGRNRKIEKYKSELAALSERYDETLNRNFLNLGIIESRNYIRISYGSFLYAGTNGISPFS